MIEYWQSVGQIALYLMMPDPVSLRPVTPWNTVRTRE
jgi:hypothetical protein